MCIKSIKFASPLRFSNENQTSSSLLIRILAVAIGSISLSIGIVVLRNQSNVFKWGDKAGWALTSSGALLLLSGVFLRCIKKK